MANLSNALLVCALALAPVLGAARESAPDDSTCGRQIRDDVAQRFGQTVTSIQFRFAERGGRSNQPTNQAIASVSECPGWHFYELLGDEYQCQRQAHFGRVSNLIFYRSSGDGC